MKLLPVGIFLVLSIASCSRSNPPSPISDTKPQPRDTICMSDPFFLDFYWGMPKAEFDQVLVKLESTGQLKSGKYYLPAFFDEIEFNVKGEFDDSIGLKALALWKFSDGKEWSRVVGALELCRNFERNRWFRSEEMMKPRFTITYRVKGSETYLDYFLNYHHHRKLILFFDNNEMRDRVYESEVKRGVFRSGV